MTDRYVIEGEMVRHIRETIVAEAPLSALGEHLVSYLPTFMPDMPAGIRAMAIDQNVRRGGMIIERPPRVHAIRVRHHGGVYPRDEERNDDSGSGVFNVLFPWTYFGIPFRTAAREGTGRNFEIDGTYLWFARERYTSLDSVLYNAACPNVDRGGLICWGGTLQPQPTLAQYVDAMVNGFFQSDFNQDLGHVTPFNNSMVDWEANSDSLDAFLDWPMWANATHQTARDAFEQQLFANTPLPDVASVADTFVNMPPLPENFSTERAYQYLRSLDDGPRRRLLWAMQHLAEEQATNPEQAATPEEATA